MDPGNIARLSYEDLKEYTDNFSEENYIGKLQFGKVYRGKLYGKVFRTPHVMVKIWEISEIYMCYRDDNEQRLMDEITLLRHEKLISHPGMVKLYGYCFEGEHLGVVYDFNPLDTVYNLLPKDDFTWLLRIKVALGFARLLKFLHSGNSLYEPFVIRNVDVAHLMLDEEYNPKLIDFGMITGGIFPDRTIYQLYVYGCYGYTDPSYPYGPRGGWSEKSDVFAFGVVLLNLITKRVYTEEDRKSLAPFVYEWAQNEYESDESTMGIKHSKRSLVHESLEADPVFYSSDGPKITKLAMRCVEDNHEDRPTMKQVVKYLVKLQAVQHHAIFF